MAVLAKERVLNLVNTVSYRIWDTPYEFRAKTSLLKKKQILNPLQKRCQNFSQNLPRSFGQ